MTRLLFGVDDLMAINSRLSSRAPELAVHWRHLRAPDIDFMTAPHQGTARVDGRSVVRLDVDRTRELFEAIGAGELDTYRRSHDVTMLPGPRNVR